MESLVVGLQFLLGHSNADFTAKLTHSVGNKLVLGPHKTKTLASLVKWSIDTKIWNMSLLHQIFHGHRIFQHFYHMTSFKSINTVFEVGKYHSWPNNLPFGGGYWGAKTCTYGSDPSAHSRPSGRCYEIISIYCFQPNSYGIVPMCRAFVDLLCKMIFNWVSAKNVINDV